MVRFSDSAATYVERPASNSNETALLSPQMLGVLTQIIECRSEALGWNLCLDIASELYGVDTVIALEFLEHDRLVVRAVAGDLAIPRGLVLPVAPGSQAAYAYGEERVIVSNDLLNENRFVPSNALTDHGVRASMSISVEIEGGRHALFGVHSQQENYFRPRDVESFETLASFFGAAIGRLRHWGEVELQARVDPVASVLSRSAILHHLQDLLEANRHPTVLLIGLDGFKAVNDDAGRSSGDEALRTTAQRIERNLGPSDQIGRIRGDEFLVVIDRPDGPALADLIVGHIEEVMMIGSRSIQLSASIGVVQQRQGEDLSAIVERADQMMSKAKSAGRGEVCSEVEPESSTELNPNLVASKPEPFENGPTLALVKSAIENLQVVVQPIVDIATQQIFGVEALTRGPAGHDLEFPDRLFRAAATFGHLGELELASKKLAFDLELDDGVELFVNLEPVLACDEAWMAELTQAWKRSRRTSMTVELTERAVWKSPGNLVRSVDACRNQGWRIALDDLGTRSDSLAALRWINPDVVKLDMSLMANNNPAHSAHVVAAIAAFQGMERRGEVAVVAEGVETVHDLKHASTLGASLVQGYLYGRPCSNQELRDQGLPAIKDASLPRSRRSGERVATKSELLAMSRHVEAATVSSDAILVAAVQHQDNLTERTANQYESLARRCGFTGMIGAGLTESRARQMNGVRTANIEPGDPNLHTWAVIMMSPTNSIGFWATEMDPDWRQHGVDDPDRLFSYRHIVNDEDAETAARELLRYF